MKGSSLAPSGLSYLVVASASPPIVSFAAARRRDLLLVAVSGPSTSLQVPKPVFTSQLPPAA